MTLSTQDIQITAAELIGLVGVALYFASFTLLQMGKLRGGTVSYTLMNLGASSCVLISLYAAFNVSTLLIQVFWIVVSVLTLIRLWQISQARLGSEFDRRWADIVLPDMPRDDAVALLSVGQHENTRDGLTLLRQGAAVRAMYLLTEGDAEVIVDGTVVQRLKPGALVGEFGVMTSAPATATVRLRGEGSLYRFDAATLQARTHRDVVLADIVNRVIQSSTIEKIMQKNLSRPQAPARSQPPILQVV